MSVIHVAVHEGPPYWRIEASPKKQMDKMVKEATRSLKKQGIKDPEWKIRKIGAKAAAEPVAEDSATATPAQKRKANR